MTKNEIINTFLEDNKSETSKCLNPYIYQTNFKEISDLYDLVERVLDSGANWNEFLITERAINSQGYIIQDREVSFYDKEKRGNVSNKVVFKYFIFNWLKKEIERQKDYKQAINWQSIPEALDNKNYLTNFAKGLKTGKPEKIKNILNSARQKYTIKS